MEARCELCGAVTPCGNCGGKTSFVGDTSQVVIPSLEPITTNFNITLEEK